MFTRVNEARATRSHQEQRKERLAVMKETKEAVLAIEELQPGAKLRDLFRCNWPEYRSCFLREGEAARPSFVVSLRMLRRHMPELVPIYERLVDLVGGGDLAARFLAMYCPPALFSGCSQAIWTRDRIALIRNYDYVPQLWDGVLLHSAWTSTHVIAMSDNLWGVLDGMNEHGLAVSLAFGGRAVIGKGFDIALVLRYLLETCCTTREATAVLCRVPVHMAYNVAIVDRQGDYATAFLAPDHDTRITRTPLSVNHQGHIELPRQARAWKTVEREHVLATCFQNPQQTLDDLTHQFLQPPLYRRLRANDWGTLYTSSYYPATGEIECRWPDDVWHQSFTTFTESHHLVEYRHVRSNAQRRGTAPQQPL